MSNANLIPVKQRKQPVSSAGADWLFPAAKNETAPATKAAVKEEKKKKKKKRKKKEVKVEDTAAESSGNPEQFKKFHSDILKREIPIGAHHAQTKPLPSVALLNAIARYFAEIGFVATGRVLTTERQGRSTIDGWKDNTKIKADKRWPTLGKIFKDWEMKWEADNARSSSSEEDSSGEEDTSSEEESSSGEDSDIEMQDAPSAGRESANNPTSSSYSCSSSDSDADDEKEVVFKAAPLNPKTKNLKRKPASLSSGSSSSSEDETPKTKKAKVVEAKVAEKKVASTKRKSPSPSSDSSDSSSSDSSSSEDEAPKAKKAKVSETKVVEIKAAAAKEASSSSSSDSDSDSSSESDSGCSTAAVATKTPLPQSDSSDSSSASDSESGDSMKGEKQEKQAKKDSTATSVTLSDKKSSSPASDSPSSDSDSDSSSSESESEAATRSKSGDKVVKEATKATTVKTVLEPAPLPPNPAILLPKQKKTNRPFSRIPENIKLDPRLASNAFVPYDYAQKAHEDLIVTKGKSFTKEKNKKKRGSYRGGPIDVHGKKGIKFED